MQTPTLGLREGINAGEMDFKMRCPFHLEKTPSCFVHYGKFKCFGCGESGDWKKLEKKIRSQCEHEWPAEFNLYVPGICRKCGEWENEVRP